MNNGKWVSFQWLNSPLINYTCRCGRGWSIVPIDFQDGGKAVEEPPQGAISIYRCMRCVQRSLLERMHPWLLVVLEFRHAVFVCTLLMNCCHGLNIVPSVILVLVVEFFWGDSQGCLCHEGFFLTDQLTCSHERTWQKEFNPWPCLRKSTASLPQQDSKNHHPSPGLSASPKIRNTLPFLTDYVVLAAQVGKDNWLISQSRKEVHWAFRACHVSFRRLSLSLHFPVSRRSLRWKHTESIRSHVDLISWLRGAPVWSF